jgi:hypothetical protein
MTKEEAMTLALEALENCYARLHEDEEILEAITAIKQARALDKMAENARELGLDYEPVLKDNSNYRLDPPVAEPAPVPTSWMEMVTVNLVREGVNKHKARELAEHFYTTPFAQRPWVGLTDEERDDLLDNYITAEGRARAIEAKLKEKNT